MARVDGMRRDGEHSLKRAVGRPKTIEAAPGSLAQLLTLIRTGVATTRLDIEQETQLGRAVVADRLANLQTLGMIEDGEIGASTGGRAPRHVRFRASAGYLLVATLDRAAMAVGVADLAGTLLQEHHEAADPADGPTALLNRLTMLFLWLMEDYGGKDAIWGVALALPEAQDDRAGLGLRASEVTEDWRDIDLRAELMLRFGAPVWIRSATEMMTAGELKAGDGASDMLFVQLGRTIDAGLVTAGRLYRGAQGAAGLIGHVQTGEASSVICRCGSRGCLESLVGSDGIAAQASAGAGESRFLAETLARNGFVAAADVATGAQLGDAYCADLIARCGRLIGDSLAPLVNLLNPSLIVLGGGIAQSGDILLAAVREAVYRNSHPLVTRELRIIRSRMGSSSGLVGAAHVAAEELFAHDMLASWIGVGGPRRMPDLIAEIAAARVALRQTSMARMPPKMLPPGSTAAL